MARNIEIKARVPDINFCVSKAETLSGAKPNIIKQEDIFFNCENGRLKLRIFSESRGELIFYMRADKTGPKTSEYFISHTQEPRQLLEVLDKSYGTHGIVKKIRKLYMIGRTRVHIDQVEKLGNFLEFEVVLNEDESITEGEVKAQELIKAFSISETDLLSGAYIDMLKQNFV